MKQGYTDIVVVLDRSGSMGSIKDDTIGGFNQFLKEQKETPGEATITLAQFDDQYEVVFQAANVKNTEPLTDKTFIPRGTTALLDAIGRTIQDTGKRYEALNESERPEKVVFVIITDGYENASHKFTADKVNEMIQHQRDVYKWEFVFLGANQDAITSAAKLGISAANALTYGANSQGVGASFRSVSRNISSYRTGLVADPSFTKEDRDAQEDAGVKN